MDEQQNLTLGSLFDGIGGFPYAASFFGIRALWASDILPCAVSVTKRRLPQMEHVGDITKLHGGTLPPVDIITFGSPCQDVSTAGRRRGIKGERSILFFEAIRIINEMREATNGRYPTWALWENVPGALSSNKGLDYQAVLEAFTETEVPVPRSGKWANAGMVRGGRADIAWCVYNAQYFGTAQRRRRIFLVADFGGERAGEILFVPKSLQGYFAAGGTPKQGSAAYASRGADGPVEILNDQGGGSMNVERDGNAPTLRSQTHGHLPVVCKTEAQAGAGCLTPWDVQSRRIHDDNGVWPALYGGEGGGHGYVATNDGEILCRATAQTNAETLENLSATLTCYHEQPIICGAVGVHQNQGGSIHTSDTAYSLTTTGSASSRNAPLVAHPVICAATAQANAEVCEGLCPTITEAAGKSGSNKPSIVHPDICGTLCASGAGLSRPGGMASETDLCVVQKVPDPEAIPIHDRATRYKGGGSTRGNDGSGNGLGVGKSGDPAPTITAGDRHAVAVSQRQTDTQNLDTAYCLQGNMIGRKDENGPRGSGVKEDVSFTLTAADTPAVAAVDCRNLRESPELSGTLQAKENGSYSLNYQNPVRMGYIVRRLTPTECERLQGYPDGWTAFGHDEKSISDTARYMMLGNSVAVPCVAYVLLGIAEAHRKGVK